ncbi:MAG: hypothetical protein KatS3mg027_1450 [Bacteroidia bacterium]|nr:MAG: hypothetical protein KatS3mg027_1450 [Bacteroidia bacterium]
MKWILSWIIIIWNVQYLLACQCPMIQWSKEGANQYDFIARVVIDKIIPQQNNFSVAEVEILNLFKGKSGRFCKILFPENDPCAIPVREGEEWIIYAKEKQINTFSIDWCGWSRKRFVNDVEDFFIATHVITYDEELNKLQQAFPEIAIDKAIQPSVFHKNIIPDKTEMYIYLALSLVGFLIIGLIIKKYLK